MQRSLAVHAVLTPFFRMRKILRSERSCLVRADAAVINADRLPAPVAPLAALTAINQHHNCSCAASLALNDEIVALEEFLYNGHNPKILRFVLPVKSLSVEPSLTRLPRTWVAVVVSAGAPAQNPPCQSLERWVVAGAHQDRLTDGVSTSADGHDVMAVQGSFAGVRQEGAKATRAGARKAAPVCGVVDR